MWKWGLIVSFTLYPAGCSWKHTNSGTSSKVFRIKALKLRVWVWEPFLTSAAGYLQRSRRQGVPALRHQTPTQFTKMGLKNETTPQRSCTHSACENQSCKALGPASQINGCAAWNHCRAELTRPQVAFKQDTFTKKVLVFFHIESQMWHLHSCWR